MMDLESKGELPTPRSSFSIFDPKIQRVIYGSSLYVGSRRVLSDLLDFNGVVRNEDRIIGT